MEDEKKLTFTVTREEFAAIMSGATLGAAFLATYLEAGDGISPRAERVVEASTMYYTKALDTLTMPAWNNLMARLANASNLVWPGTVAGAVTSSGKRVPLDNHEVN